MDFLFLKKYKDPRLAKYNLMLKIYLTEENKVAGSINAVQYRDDKDDFFKGYFIVDRKDLEVPLNNFSFGEEDVSFKEGFFYTKSGIKLSLNNLIENIEYNHISKKVDFYQRVSRFFYESLLRIIFWLGDSSYSYKKMLPIRVNPDRYKDDIRKEKLKEDPLFKYFKINKNILFIFILLVLPVVLLSCEYYNMEVTRLPVVLSGLATFFLLEKISSLVNNLFELLLQKMKDDSPYVQKAS
jgi:hypothetical protein